ncbi:MAG: hypothetical protein IKJ77_09730 [Firmicutes bacterium]|nr:hypothetical protein [Bacillota bacterium]
MKKKNFTKFEIVCYVVAALLAIAAVYMLVENIAYMNEYLAAYGMTFTALGSQAIQSMVTAFVPYFAYAFLALAAGRIYHAVATPKCECVCEEEAEEILELEAPVEALEAPAEEAEEVAVVLAETPASVVAEEAEETTEENEEK